ncbi:MAG: cation diffusion facilitator family transporter [Coriobacteriia bacterium]|nr:cation diffusion facilitator family transporter [Coriobacteriia bacterium]
MEERKLPESAQQEAGTAPEAGAAPEAHDASEGGKSSVIAAIAGNVGVAVVKFIASFLSGSSALFSEAIHSLVDCGNGLLLLVGMRKSRRKPDFYHPFGSGKELYFYTLIVALAIFLLGGGVALKEGIEAVQAALAGTAQIGDPLVGYVVLICAAIIEGLSLRVALKNFNAARGNLGPIAFIKQAKDPSLYTVVMEDSAAEVGLLFALVGTVLTQATRNAVFDGAASIAIGLLLCAVAVVLLRATKGLLVGVGVNPEEVEQMRALVEQDPMVVECGRILTNYMGPANLLVAMDVTFQPSLRADDADGVTDRIEAAIRQQWPETSEVFIEVECLGECLRQQQVEDTWDVR